MSTRSRAPNGRFATTNATTDPTGGGGQADTEPDLSANTETEPPVDQGAAPDPGHLAGQGGEGAGTDTKSSTEPFQDGSGSDDEEDLPTDKDQSDPAKAFRKAAEDGIRDWLGTVTSKDEMGTVVQALRSAGIHIPGIEGEEENPTIVMLFLSGAYACHSMIRLALNIPIPILFPSDCSAFCLLGVLSSSHRIVVRVTCR